MFHGLSAFPITPISGESVDVAAYGRIVERLADAHVDSIGALGSTGSYPYLSTAERARAARAAVAAAGEVPVIVGVGALTLSDVLRNVESAQNAGAAGLLLSVMTYQPLTDEEVIGFIEDVAAHSSTPICLYDNPRTTHVTFTDEMLIQLAGLAGVRSIKLPGTPVPDFTDRVDALRAAVPASTTLGVSGDALASDALLGGADVWYSVIAGTLPTPALELTRAAHRGDRATVDDLEARLAPLWDLMARYGSYRVVTQLAAIIGLTEAATLPRPVRPLPARAATELEAITPQLTADRS
ncbi:dihydrodipicolinate synthase family protein [Microbacterium xanthum]|uniref:dihydrodipicolinate synthase family protein n=1 Tax=Microbacterium xanthum TaxID=3079794 RepID=UPI002AD51F2B|nr:dihydrodipicolinate synthase family protein [Microbacterium sp. KSW-48]MDZ8171966.1 dihydrodipicolinate synthase family protein [Microbacterium sp. KSW-48]